MERIPNGRYTKDIREEAVKLVTDHIHQYFLKICDQTRNEEYSVSHPVQLRVELAGIGRPNPVQ